MSKRSTFNTTVTAKARKAGVYTEVLANWPLVQNAYKDGLTPHATLKGIIATLDLNAPAKVTPKVKAAPKAVTPTVLVAAADLPRNTTEPLPLERVVYLTLAKGQRHVPTTDVMAFPCGWAEIVVHVDGRSAFAKALTANGFTRRGTGVYGFPFWADGGQSADAAFEKAAETAKSLDLSVRARKIDAKVYATTIID